MIRIISLNQSKAENLQKLFPGSRIQSNSNEFNLVNIEMPETVQIDITASNEGCVYLKRSGIDVQLLDRDDFFMIEMW